MPRRIHFLRLKSVTLNTFMNIKGALERMDSLLFNVYFLFGQCIHVSLKLPENFYLDCLSYEKENVDECSFTMALKHVLNYSKLILT